MSDDGVPLTLPLDKPLRLVEGAHRFAVSAKDHATAEEHAAVRAGKAIELRFDPAPLGARSGPSEPPALPRRRARLACNPFAAGLACLGSF